MTKHLIEYRSMNPDVIAEIMHSITAIVCEHSPLHPGFRKEADYAAIAMLGFVDVHLKEVLHMNSLKQRQEAFDNLARTIAVMGRIVATDGLAGLMPRQPGGGQG